MQVGDIKGQLTLSRDEFRAKVAEVNDLIGPTLRVSQEEIDLGVDRIYGKQPREVVAKQIVDRARDRIQQARLDGIL